MLTPEEIEAMRQGIKNSNAVPQADEPDTIPEPTPEPAPAAPATHPAEGDSSLKNPTPPAPMAGLHPDPTPAAQPSKSFEEYLAEKTGGKFKKWEEVESVMNAPKDQFVDDEVRHWNELKKKGAKLDRTFFELQSLSLESLKTPKDILLQSMKLKEENSGLSDKTLLFQIEKKYGLSNWIEKEETELTDEDIANMELLGRDAKIEYNWLQNYKKERTFVPEVDPAVAQQQADAKAAWQASWDRYVDDNLYGKVTGISVQIDPATNDSFEYKISEVDRKEMGDIMKTLPKDVNAIFRPFLQEDAQGNPSINHEKVYEMLLKYKIFDQAVSKARQDGEALGAKKELKKIKNVGFVPGEGNTVVETAPKTESEAIAAQLRKQGVRIL